MKINSSKVNIQNIYNRQIINQEKIKSLDSRKDEFSVSEEAKDFQTVYKCLSEVPDVRQDKIDLIKAKIEQGDYNIPSSEIAKKIIN